MSTFGTAVFEGRYRYCLARQWASAGEYVLFVCLNPSTATASRDDATVRRCVGYARAWGFSAMRIANLFAYRARETEQLLRARDPVGPKNDEILLAMAAGADVVIAAWGNQGAYLGRATVVRSMLPHLYYLRLTRRGQPAHPLYLPRALRPQLWR